MAGVTEMSLPIPTTEEERTAEALTLISQITDEDKKVITTWEMETIKDLSEGKAATRIRLRELREIVKKINNAREASENRTQ